MTTTLRVGQVVVIDHVYDKGGISVSPVSSEQLVDALIAEGGEIVNTAGTAMLRVAFDKPGRYLVFPIPAEKETTA